LDEKQLSALHGKQRFDVALLLLAQRRRGAENDKSAALHGKRRFSSHSRNTALAMSQENVEIVRRDYVAFDRGDFAAILEDVDPEVAVQAHPRGDEGKYEGKDGFLRFMTDWIEPFEDFTQTPEEFTDAGDLVVVRVLQRARGKGSGVPVESHFWLLHSMRNGKVIKLDLYDNETQALKAAGLSE
jgi:ketosteroid isomerase-like protein